MILLQRSSKKGVALPSRPEQPTVAEIVQDVKGASADDIVFTYLQNEKHALQTPDSNFSDSTFSFGDTSKLSINSPQQNNSVLERSAADNDSVYQKAVNFIQHTEKLQHAPAGLHKACSQLDQLSSELTNSIDALKEQAQALVENASVPKTKK